MERPAEIECCPFCGRAVMGDPWNVKQHVDDRHRHRVGEFIPYLNVLIRKWSRRP